MNPDNLGPQFWHGTPDDRNTERVGAYGLHVGTYQAAKEALEARIGRRADGQDWDGNQEYGKTLLGGYRHGYGVKAEPNSLPNGSAAYSDNTPVPMDARPNLFPVRIVGPMTNTPGTPHEDFRANGLMRGQIKQGRARRGYFYKNVGEDAGSISAVVPNWNHLERM